MPVIEQEFDSSGSLTMTRMNVLGARGIEAVINVPVSGSATMKWLMVDGHGNVVRTMNTNFGLSAYQWRGVWGERQTGTLLTRKGYVANLGHQEDETGLVYMRARYYEPTTGRFISEDLARDGVNWYLYADANPVNRVDASGRESEWLLSFFNRFVTPILERLGQHILSKPFVWHKILFGKSLAIAVFELATILEGSAFMLIKGGMRDTTLGWEFLRATGGAGSISQGLFSGLLGAQMITRGVAGIAAGLALLAISRVLAGIAYGME